MEYCNVNLFESMSYVEHRSFTVASAWEMSYWSTNVMDW